MISSDFKAEFSKSLKELLHQELWMHNHLQNLTDAPALTSATKETKGNTSPTKLLEIKL